MVQGKFDCDGVTSDKHFDSESALQLENLHKQSLKYSNNGPGNSTSQSLREQYLATGTK